MAKRKIAVIGVGKIAVDQHLPVIDRSDDFKVAATVSTRMIAHNGLPVFKTPSELYTAMPEVDLVAICTPPGVRHAYLREAIDAGKDAVDEVKDAAEDTADAAKSAPRTTTAKSSTAKKSTRSTTTRKSGPKA